MACALRPDPTNGSALCLQLSLSAVLPKSNNRDSKHRSTEKQQQSTRERRERYITQILSVGGLTSVLRKDEPRAERARGHGGHR